MQNTAIRKTKPRSTFPVDKVTKSTRRLRTTSLKRVIRHALKGVGKTQKRIGNIRMGKSLILFYVSYYLTMLLQFILGCLVSILPSLKKIVTTAPTKNKLVKTKYNSFMVALHTAYARHYPLTISPDMIWLLIAQGFANHVNENSEALRSHFVNFEGIKELTIERDDFTKGSATNNWQAVIEDFSEELSQQLDPKFTQLITTPFSTTQLAEKIAFQITLMDVMKSYFNFVMLTRCGIPEITIEGTVEDWKNIEQRAKQLAQYDLAWWIDDLLPILQQFTKAAAGTPDSSFWKNIYKVERGCRGEDITGWILFFFPYVKYGSSLWSIRKQLENPNRQELLEEFNEDIELSATMDIIPSGISQVNFTWIYYGKKYPYQLVAGFLGYEQNEETLALRPNISWGVLRGKG